MGKMIKAGIYGAAGYTAGELLRILINHPEAEVVCAQSGSQAGKPVNAVHKDLTGETDLEFDAHLDLKHLDVLFLCKGHGESRTFMKESKVPDHLRIIDLSQDYRLKSTAEGFIYGLPELNRETITPAVKIANPGCFATCIELGLIPAAKEGIIRSEIHTTGITGSTGAGQGLSPTSHFSWREGNVSVYKAFTHQHLAEIGESLHAAGGVDHHINFIPVRGNFTRGIMATSYFDSESSIEEAYRYYEAFYSGHPFTHVTRTNPDLKMVVNTNKAIIHLMKEGNKLLVISVIDNLIKGASGQAVQNMNLIFGLEETAGLYLKSTAF